MAGCEPELALLHQLSPSCGSAIDAGANEGPFTYPLAELYDRLYAFEINLTFSRPSATVISGQGKLIPGRAVHELCLPSRRERIAVE